jgi:hypothetical protein
MVTEVQTKWGPLTRHALKKLKDGYAVARRDSKRQFQIDGQTVVTDFAKYMIEYAEGEGLVACKCH